MLSAATVCLALSLYYEARSDSLVGMLAVGQVVMNRVHDPRWPKTVCDVVHQGGTKRNRCQFSFYCDGLGEYPRQHPSWDIAVMIAQGYVDGRITFPALKSATCYHSVKINTPTWAKKKIAQFGEHVFYAC